MNYIVNADVIGYQRIEITDDSLTNSKGNVVVVTLGEESSNYLYAYYNAVRNLILNENRVIILLVGTESKIRKQICMMAASYRVYDIYTVNSRADIDSEYLEALLEREPTLEEVETYIGADISAYSEMNEILLKLCDNASLENVDKVADIVYGNKEMIECFPSIIDYMKKTIDNYNSGLDTKVAELKAKVEEADNNCNKMRLEAEIKAQELAKALSEVEGLKRESAAAKQRCVDLEQQVNNAGPSIRTYSTINTSSIKCKVKSILYFKEISSVRFINTFIVKLMEILQRVDKLNVKLVIYDNASPFNCTYKPIGVINASDYLANKETYLNKSDRLVVIEPNKVILEDILTSDYDCVIVYDRLRQIEDLVTGNCVYKYWVISSMYHIEKVESITKLDRSKIITNVGACIDALAISELPGFKNMTPSAKTSQYMQMQNVGNLKGKITDIIKTTTNLKAIIDANKK